MGMYLERVGAESPPARRIWRPRDCSLYALGLGAGWDELEFVTEGVANLEQKVYPTFVLAGVMSAEAETWPDPGFETGSYDLHQLVLGQQRLVLHDVVGPSGDVTSRTRVAGIYDKGSGALVLLEVQGDDTATGRPVFTATTGLFVIGEGGFGGERGPSGAPAPPDRPPDDRVEHATLGVQTLLYRHAGNDANPVHLDPDFARRAGFRGPILTGLNTLGFAGRAMVHSVAAGDAQRLRSIDGRFAAPGYNGDVLTTEVWEGDDLGVDELGDRVVLYRVVNQEGAVLLDRGRATFATPAR